MALLKLISITCIGQAETFTDELYVTFNGTKRKLPDMTKGQTKNLNDEFLFEGSRPLAMFEDDGDHWYDRDDFIASHTLTPSPVDKTLIFKASSGNARGAHYELVISIDPPVQRAILRLKEISCVRQAETFTDELYVTFNGTKRKLPDMTVGSIKPLGDEFLFEGSRQLAMFEDDGNHWYDRDDFIASHTITTSPVDTTLDFKAPAGSNAEGADYRLSFSVTPIP